MTRDSRVASLRTRAGARWVLARQALGNTPRACLSSCPEALHLAILARAARDLGRLGASPRLSPGGPVVDGLRQCLAQSDMYFGKKSHGLRVLH